jgi:3',5'-cyclic AMP phosphodiesterase CpdA
MRHHNLKFAILLLLSMSIFPVISFAQFTFAHITDLHVADGMFNVGSYDLNGVEFQIVLNNLNNLNTPLAFVAASGDISNMGSAGTVSGTEGMYGALTGHLFANQLTNPAPGDFFIDANRTIPIYFAPGNHEYYTTLTPPTSDTNLAYYLKHVSPDADYFIVKNNAIILFVRSGWDDNRSILIDQDIDNPEGSGLTLGQCQWVRNTLHTYSNKRKIIVMHHPPSNANGILYDGTPYTAIIDTADGSLMNNRTMFLNICDSNHVDIVLCGHVHQNVVCNRKGTVVPENWPSGTRYVQTAGEFQGSYRIITVDSNFVYVGTPQLADPTVYVGNSLTASSIDYDIFYKPYDKSLLITCLNKANESVSTQIGLFTTTGQQVYSNNSTMSQGTKKVISMGNLSKGMYILKLAGKGNPIAKKIMVN